MSESSRREFLKDAALVGAAITSSTLAEGSLFAAAAQAQRPGLPPAAGPQAVTLSWLGNEPPRVSAGVSWGVPWPQGAVGRGSTFSLRAQARDLAVQTWPLAYWPDGSVKWSGFATLAPAGLAAP